MLWIDFRRFKSVDQVTFAKYLIWNRNHLLWIRIWRRKKVFSIQIIIPRLYREEVSSGSSSKSLWMYYIQCVVANGATKHGVQRSQSHQLSRHMAWHHMVKYIIHWPDFVLSQKLRRPKNQKKSHWKLSQKLRKFVYFSVNMHWIVNAGK